MEIEIDEKYLSNLQNFYEKCRAEDEQKHWDYWTGRIDTCITLRTAFFPKNSEE